MKRIDINVNTQQENSCYFPIASPRLCPSKIQTTSSLLFSLRILDRSKFACASENRRAREEARRDADEEENPSVTFS